MHILDDTGLNGVFSFLDRFYSKLHSMFCCHCWKKSDFQTSLFIWKQAFDTLSTDYRVLRLFLKYDIDQYESNLFAELI